MAEILSVDQQPLSCEFMFGRGLESKDLNFRHWLLEMGGLVAAALASVGLIESCEELFDPRLWQGSVRTGDLTRPRVSRLSKRVWSGITSNAEVSNLGIACSPLPGVPTNRGPRSMILLDSAWYVDLPSRVSFSLPSRYCVPTLSSEWSSALVSAFVEFSLAANAETAYIGWNTPMEYLMHPLGSIDFQRTIMVPGWAVMVGEGHMEALGGYDSFREKNPGFFAIERHLAEDGEPRYHLQLTECLFDLLDPGLSDAAGQMTKVLGVLSPPPAPRLA